MLNTVDVKNGLALTFVRSWLIYLSLLFSKVYEVLKSSYHRDMSYFSPKRTILCRAGGLHCKLHGHIKSMKGCGHALRLLNGSNQCGIILPRQLSFVAYI